MTNWTRLKSTPRPRAKEVLEVDFEVAVRVGWWGERGYLC